MLEWYKMVKASSWPLATSCSSPKRNISALRTVCAKAIKRHNNNNNNNNNNNKNNNNNNLCNNKRLIVTTNNLFLIVSNLHCYLHCLYLHLLTQSFE